ncbi:MAG: PDZ domain-containing protein, partial [Actinobacteria bacterium]|nr:PDZ domain-containing protein [Actinomycetota bacterium]
LNTVLVNGPSTDQTERGPDAVAVAVSVDYRPFIVTTANAVADSDAVSIVSTGDPSDGSIVAIDGDLAYLSANTDLGVTAFTSTGSADIGEMVMVLGQEQTPVHFVTGGAVVELDAAAVREGTPVIDDTGALVALCTLVQGTDGSYVALVPIAPPPAVIPTTTSTTVAPESPTTTTTTPSSTTTTPVAVAWAGIKFGDVAPDASPVVVGVPADGPAAIAGLLPGDRIVAVDGVTVSRVDEVLAAIKAKAPGSSIVFTVVSSPPASGGSSTSTSTSTTTTAVAATTTTLAPATHDVTVVLGVFEPTV